MIQLSLHGQRLSHETFQRGKSNCVEEQCDLLTSSERLISSIVTHPVAIATTTSVDSFTFLTHHRQPLSLLEEDPKRPLRFKFIRREHQSPAFNRQVHRRPIMNIFHLLAILMALLFSETAAQGTYNQTHFEPR